MVRHLRLAVIDTLIPNFRCTKVTQGAAVSVDLLSAPIETNGDSGETIQSSAMIVTSAMRQACLSAEYRLLSEHQPDLSASTITPRDRRTSGCTGNRKTAWIVVDVATKAWSQLAYQFGHELGHVVCNSWMWNAHSPPPSCWLENPWLRPLRSVALNDLPPHGSVIGHLVVTRNMVAVFRTITVTIEEYQDPS